MNKTFASSKLGGGNPVAHFSWRRNFVILGMLYHQAVNDSLQFVLNNPDHQLLVSIQTVNYDRIFVTRNGRVFTGSSRLIKQQLSATLRREIRKHYLTLKNDNLITDEPELGSSLAIQKHYLEFFLSFDNILHSQIVTWFRIRQIFLE